MFKFRSDDEFGVLVNLTVEVLTRQMNWLWMWKWEVQGDRGAAAEIQGDNIIWGKKGPNPVGWLDQLLGSCVCPSPAG